MCHIEQYEAAGPVDNPAVIAGAALVIARAAVAALLFIGMACSIVY